jgi:hypothetical protein
MASPGSSLQRLVISNETFYTGAEAPYQHVKHDMEFRVVPLAEALKPDRTLSHHRDRTEELLPTDWLWGLGLGHDRTLWAGSCWADVSITAIPIGEVSHSSANPQTTPVSYDVTARIKAKGADCASVTMMLDGQSTTIDPATGSAELTATVVEDRVLGGPALPSFALESAPDHLGDPATAIYTYTSS